MPTIKRNLINCLACKGTKTIPGPPPGGGDIECPSCEGLGKMAIGWVEVCEPGIFESHVILECLDATEHAALTDAQKDGVRIILSCGQVDLNDGKVGKVRLWNWFGAESDTVANLTELLE